MVITKIMNGFMLQQHSVKESVSSTTVPRIMTRRIAELPSLRYGPIGAKSATSGPLRISLYHNDTLPKTKKTSQISDGSSSYKPVRPPRRVRFTLPSPEDADVADDAVSPTDVHLKTRASHQQLLDSIARQTATPYRHDAAEYDAAPEVETLVTSSPGVRTRVHPTGRYIRGTLSPTSSVAPPPTPSPGSLHLVRAARDGDDGELKEVLRRAVMAGVSEGDLNATDTSGRTALSYIASNGPLELLELVLQLPGLDVNKPDNEGNTPLHFAAQAGQLECLNCLLTKCSDIHVDARNNLGFTPLMKAALQGRNKCAKVLLFAGANPTLRDNGRGFRADQWARFCGRYICADVIEKHARHRLLERSTSYGGWGGENELGARILMGKVMPVPQIPVQTSHGFKSKLRKVFRTSSSSANADSISSARLVTQLTSAALCASTPVLPTASTMPPMVKSLIRPLTVPRLQITLANNPTTPSNNNNNTTTTNNNNIEDTPAATIEEGVKEKKIEAGEENEGAAVVKPVRTKKKK